MNALTKLTEGTWPPFDQIRSQHGITWQLFVRNYFECASGIFDLNANDWLSLRPLYVKSAMPIQLFCTNSGYA